MAITVKHSKVSTIPDADDDALVRPSDWNADHTLVGLGTMAEQNANAVTITGGTINGTTIGATTPSTVNATTLSGQTARLNGTGQNFQRWSEDFTDAAWSKTNINVTANATTAPNGTLTAEKIIATNTTAQHFIDQGALIGVGAIYTFSIYAKASEYTTMALRENSLGQVAVFNLSTGIPTPNVNLNPVMVDVGNGWYRCSVSRQNGQSQLNIRIHPNQEASFTGDNVSGIFIWGAQSEYGSTATTYIPTTTTAVYGTPTLSFSGVSEIGLQSNGALYLQPAGTGAIQAQATTSTTAGGNVRGANAVDWQTSRTAATQVAVSSFAVLGGGVNNTVGSSGVAATIGGGANNNSNNAYTFVGGGQQNIASAIHSNVVSGKSNTAGGIFNFIGAGFTNSGTSGTAVTTQSATMNGTTAVTLSGSNASIRVGQYIFGTSIASDTYVAAISGTSLTLSQAASGLSTSTLSFFTPHGVVVGGGNNQATGSYSFIGGGGDAGTAAQRNTASNDWSTIVGGRTNTASGSFSFIGGGPNNTASGLVSAILGGQFNIASGSYSSVVSGNSSTASGGSSSVLGGQFGTTRGITGNVVFPASNAPITNSTGVSQAALVVLARQTTDATATVLASDNATAGTTNQVILPNNSAYFFRGEVVSGVTGGGNTKGWTIEGVIKRGANAAATTLVGSTVMSTFGDAGAATWTIALTADTTNGGLRVTFTGQAGTTIRTVCQIRTTEMTY